MRPYRPKRLDGKACVYRCIYCGLGGARTIVFGGRAHKRCIPKEMRRPTPASDKGGGS
jgi:hypothetical protein